MGDIREFWLALTIYVVSATTIFVIVSTTPQLNLPPALRVVAVLGGGIVLTTAIILTFAGVMKLCSKRKT